MPSDRDAQPVTPPVTAPAETVLIVDDDSLNRMALAELLAGDFRILLAKDGVHALAVLDREAVDLVLLDISMPRMDGHEVLRRMKADPRLADLPVIFITGKSDEADEQMGFELGAADYVQKPFRPAVVKARVQLHMLLRRQRAELNRLAHRDALTGLINRRGFDTALGAALQKAARAGTMLAVGLFDVDYFKQYNDHYGHLAGDDALVRVAEVIDRASAAVGATASRYGGEEFALLLPEGCDPFALLDRIRAAVEGLRLPHVGAPLGSGVLTLSGGGITCRIGTEETARQLLGAADERLYRAKKEGRNRVVFDAVG